MNQMAPALQTIPAQGAAVASPRPVGGRASRTGRAASFLFFAAAFYALYWGWKEREYEHLTAEHGLGYALGIAGALAMLTLLLYPMRKRLRVLRVLGPVAVWFRAHMLLGIVGPVLVLYHANFSWGSLNSNVALAAMLAVAASGLVGRFIYARIHHGLYGSRVEFRELRDEIAARRGEIGLGDALPPALARRLSWFDRVALAEPGGVVSSGLRLMQVWISTRLAGPGLRRAAGRVLDSAARQQNWSRAVRRARAKALRRELKAYLGSLRRLAAFAFFERLFALWHVLHLPLFIILVFAAVAHVIAVHMY